AREETGADVEILWSDEGFVVRFPDVDQPPDPRLLLRDRDEVQSLVVRQLGATALFAAKFRENAARSLLLPKRRPGMRAPLWQQRKRAADLLAVASRYGSFPVLLETYRECLRDFFDMPALVSTLADARRRAVRVAVVDSDQPSPFSASLLFSYVASFLYDGDAPKYRDALGVPLPPGLPESLLAPASDPLANLVARFARTHAPFTAFEVASRYGLAAPVVDAILMRLTAEGRLLEGEFRPGGT